MSKDRITKPLELADQEIALLLHQCQHLRADLERSIVEIIKCVESLETNKEQKEIKEKQAA